MMARSHTLIGMAAATSLAAAGVWPITPTVLIAAFVGSLAPDIDHPDSTLGRPLFFLSYPLNAAIGHRTGTHSFLALAFCTAAVMLSEIGGFADAGYGFFVGYAAHIAADLITVEGCALLFPWDRARYAFWPAVMTGGFTEPFVALSSLSPMRTIGTLKAPPRSPRILPMNWFSLASSTTIVVTSLCLRKSQDEMQVSSWRATGLYMITCHGFDKDIQHRHPPCDSGALHQ